MGKTRDLFKKVRDTKGTFHAKMGSIKDRNGMELREAEDIEVARRHKGTMQKSKMAVWGGLTNSCEKKRSEKQRRKGKI